MSHVRTRIRDAVASALGAAVPLTGRVDKARLRPRQPSDLPRACVYATTEAEQSDLLQPVDGPEFEGDDGRVLQRILPVVVDLYDLVDDPPDDALNVLAVAAEIALGADPTFGGLAIESHLVSSVLDWDRDASDRIGLARLVYQVTYWTPADDPETALGG